MMDNKEFTLTEDHLKLLRAFYIAWEDSEYGAPCVDPKRPYGNSGVEGDIHEILNGKSDIDLFELTDEQVEQYACLHKETQIALQILVQHAKVQPGRFRTKAPYGSEWESIES